MPSRARLWRSRSTRASRASRSWLSSAAWRCCAEHLNRDAVYRILKSEGLNRLPSAEKARKPHGTFKDYEIGFIHVDVKHLPKLQDREHVARKRYLYVAIDRASRYVRLAVSPGVRPVLFLNTRMKFS